MSSGVFKRWIIALTIGSSSLGGGILAADEAIDPYVDKIDKYEISKSSTLQDAGAVVAELSKDEPKVTLSKWSGEAEIGIKYKGIDPTTTGDRKLLTETVEWKDSKKPDEVLHAYPLPAGEGMEDGGFEIEVVLDKKPETNVFEFEIEGAGNLDFFYQPELTPEEIAEGAFRPENVVGSYAVYHKIKKDHRIGDTNYATGKAFHIFRPKAIDADGAEQWAELSYVDGVLTVTVPQEFLDKAVYPVKVDPTFGNGTAGASSITIENNLEGFVTSTSQTGEVLSISSYVDSSVAGVQAKSAIYKDTGHFAAGSDGFTETFLRGTSEELNVPTTAAWMTLNLLSPVTIEADTLYALMTWGESGAFSNVIFYDTGGRFCGSRDLDGVTYVAGTDSWPNTPLFTCENDLSSTAALSVYATFTPLSRTINASNYGYCRTLTTNNTGYVDGIGTTTAGLFPLFASSTISTLAATSSGGNVQLVATTTKIVNAATSSLYTDEPIDIVFTDESSCSFSSSIDAIPHYFEKYASTTGAFAVHLGTSNISSTSAKVVTMYYGNANATNLNSPGQVYATTSPTGIVGHWDLSVPGYATTTYPDFTDSTYNNSHGSSKKMNNANLVAGHIGNTLDFELSSDQYVNIGNTTALQITGDMTITAWIKLESQGDGTAYQIVAKDKDSGGRAYTFDYNDVDAAATAQNKLRFYINGGGTGVCDTNNIACSTNAAGTNYIPTGTWAMVTGTYDNAGRLRVYGNGSPDGITTADASIPSATANALIGRREYASFENPFDGLIDDVRIYNQTLSHADILTIYNNTSDSQTFWTIGGEQTQTPATPPPPGSSKDDFWFFRIWPPIKKEEVAWI